MFVKQKQMKRGISVSGKNAPTQEIPLRVAP
jgi:hypothetical protein